MKLVLGEERVSLVLTIRLGVCVDGMASDHTH